MLELKKYGKLTPIKIDHRKASTNYWECKCDCGKTTVVRETYLKNGHTKSCGCIRSDRMKYSNPRTTHGLRGHRLNSIWRGMKTRCYNKNSLEYSNYGGRGITVCKEWKDDFKSFYDWAMSHGYKEGLTIDRINVNGNYEPSNCRWITMKQQLRNTRRCIQITYNGETHNLSEWAEILNMDYSLLNSRISKQKWSVEKAFTTPVLNSRNDNGEH